MNVFLTSLNECGLVLHHNISYKWKLIIWFQIEQFGEIIE